MSTVAAASVAASRPAINGWLIAGAVIIPTFMEVLDTTVAIVSLRYIAGDLSAAVVDAEWVLTCYLAANATILPISGWLSARLGRRNYFLSSIAVFTIASALCGMATSLWQIIVFRIIQGLAGGGLQPSSQAILIDSFPAEKQGMAMTMFGIAALTAPVVGPTLGGYLSDYHSWRWIFYINIPIGCVAFLMTYFIVEDPDYLREERTRLLRMPLNFDYVGLALLALVMCAWEVLITKGQEWDWLGDPFGKVQSLLLMFVLGGAFLVVWEMRRENPVVNFRPLGERNFWVCCIIIFFAYAILYGTSTSLPGLLQSLFGYDAFHSGLVMSPSGLASVSMLLICGILLGRGTDARWLIGGGMLVVALGCYSMSLMNLGITPWQAIWPRIVTIAGLGMAFAPINVAAFLYTPRHMRAAAVGLFALLRNEGGSFGTSMARTVQVRRDQLHSWRVGEFLDPFNSAVGSYLERAQAFFFRITGDAPRSQRLALQRLADLREQQASSMAYFDVFFVAAILGVALAFLVLLMKRSVAEKGAHVGAE